jgi:flagella basal body P-ring formation protein FlgA
MIRYLLLSMLIVCSLFAITLKRTYMTQHTTIYASDIAQNLQKDFAITRYNDGDHAITLPASVIVNAFAKYGYKVNTNHLGYITFRQKSPIDLQKIKTALQNAFLQKYPQMEIQLLDIHPASYMQHLPKNYRVIIPHYALKNNYSTIYIKTPRHQEFFFNFTLQAKLPVIIATQKIGFHTPLTFKNTRIKTVAFQNFRGTPITSIGNHVYQSKFTIQSGSIILKRNIEPLYLVRRNHTVSATINDGGVHIIFSATALQSGIKGDTIKIRDDRQKQFNAIIIGPNMVQIQ